MRAPAADFAGFRGLTALDLDFVIFSGEKAWKRLEAMISAASLLTLEKLRLANIAFHHVAPGRGLPVPGAWIIHAPNLRWLELRLTMTGAGSCELGHLPKLDYASIMLNAQEPRDYGRLLTELSSVRELEILNFGLCHISGLYAEEDKERLVEGVNTMMRIATQLLNQKQKKDSQTLLKDNTDGQGK